MPKDHDFDVVITIRDGVAEVEHRAPWVSLQIRDYDTQGVDRAALDHDEGGEEYVVADVYSRGRVKA